MNKTVTPKQLELVGDKTRHELLLAHPDLGAIAPKMSGEALIATCDSNFDWSDNPAVILQEQPATAVYFNPDGQLVIRQRASWCNDEDFFIVISPENCNTLLDGIAARIRNG